MTRVVLATRNAGKIRELETILRETLPDVEVVGLGAFPELEDVVESGVTFIDNATLKATYAARMTNLPAVADDSGLSVDVLGGAPGVFSARWSGRHGDDAANLRLLLDQLADVPDEHRAARFRCAAVLALPDGTTVAREGDFPGTLTREPRGTGGFGYDPVLQVEGDARTAAELTPEEKNAISHRGKAFRALAPEIARLLGH
ncbi:RdgB/HAM1 family non-canonical purine NTP pyrophosphatase [Arsenicicoccus sp. oral taxon 190]|uniref:RdgB/HAM1 family non-canonical purine NTP pyrophosphatase n=1 Tax=Arsenicicoccus sp. oral taxon 190 TaxID=1658671 RepID=UPI00067A41E2|nr:RdgB/HAM1 family non-canonical purine NTP pyrophosphatase [Arsenicicoccus sp. oral taxon 190]AKT51489.1 nucleoside-triphosphate diphosphatase [Arsenicicoccus sp. oral taxon 190]